MCWAAKYTNKDSIRCCGYINFRIHTPYSYLASDVVPSSIFGLHSHFRSHSYKFGPQDKVINIQFVVTNSRRKAPHQVRQAPCMHTHSCWNSYIIVHFIVSHDQNLRERELQRMKGRNKHTHPVQEFYLGLSLINNSHSGIWVHLWCNKFPIYMQSFRVIACDCPKLQLNFWLKYVVSVLNWWNWTQTDTEAFSMLVLLISLHSSKVTRPCQIFHFRCLLRS